MSNNMPKPWIKKTVLKCLQEEEASQRGIRHRNVLTQVIKVIPDLKILIVNDKEHKISVVATEECLKDLEAKDIPFKSLKNCIVSLQNWHVSDLAHDRHSCLQRLRSRHIRSLLLYPA